jgi:DNA-binding response OmpR family regulator
MPGNPTILVIDDEVEICSFLEDVLTPAGYTVYTANRPEEGLKKVEQLRPDVVLLDLKLPDMNGVEVLRRVKAFDDTIAVIMMTGFGTMESAIAAMRLGAFDYVTKPFDLAHLRNLINDALAQRTGRFPDDLSSSGETLTEEESAFLDSIRPCQGERPCFWEVAVRTLLLGDLQFLREWTERPDVTEEDKANLDRLRRIVGNAIRRKREQPE